MKNHQPGKEANNIENQNENKKKDMSRLFQAIEVSDANWVKENLQRGDSLEQIDKYYYPGYSLLDLAAEKGNIEIVAILLEAGTDIDYSEESSPLHRAIKAGNVDVVRILIAAGADLEFEIDDAVTPLMTAAMNGQMEIAELLINAGANMNALSRYGTASEIAQIYGYPELSKMLYLRSQS